MSNRTSRFLFALLLILAATFAHSQNLRWDLGAPGSAGAVTTGGSGGYPPLLALPGVSLHWCTHPANAVPCTNFANTYPTITSASPCATSAQIVLQGSSSCVATGDNFGNLGVYTLPNTICTVTCYDYTLTVNGVSSGPYTWTAGGGGGGGAGGNPVLENCTPDQSGNSFYNVASLTNFFYGAWQFVFNATTYINCTVFIPSAQIGATLVLDIATSDSTAGHTANLQTCDQVINSGTVNIGALTCAANQTFTTTSTAYNRVTLTFNVQSTLANNSILVVKIGTSPTAGTAPTANLIVYPHFIL